VVTVTLFEMQEDSKDRDELNPTLVRNISMFTPMESARDCSPITEEEDQELIDDEKTHA